MKRVTLILRNSRFGHFKLGVKTARPGLYARVDLSLDFAAYLLGGVFRGQG